MGQSLTVGISLTPLTCGFELILCKMQQVIAKIMEKKKKKQHGALRNELKTLSREISWENKWWLFHQLPRAGSLCCWNERRHIQAMSESLIPIGQRKPSDVCLRSIPTCSALPSACQLCLQPTPTPAWWENPSFPEASHCHTLWLTCCTLPIGCYDGNTRLAQIFSKFLAKKSPESHWMGSWSGGNVRLMDPLKNRTYSDLSQDSCYGFLTQLSRNLLWLQTGGGEKHTQKNTIEKSSIVHQQLFWAKSCACPEFQALYKYFQLD